MVGVVVVLVGLVATIVGPIVKLNTSIIRLTVMMDTVMGDLGELTSKNSDTHGRIFKRLEGQEKELAGHDKRIHVLERKEDAKHA